MFLLIGVLLTDKAYWYVYDYVLLLQVCQIRCRGGMHEHVVFHLAYGHKVKGSTYTDSKRRTANTGHAARQRCRLLELLKLPYWNISLP